ncbi:small CPxCG-related zinc finger protein [Haloquadratum walsbyi C23]|uniref:Small CPxCG-related zinc finger protein n=2 Tax=Haloquadratum walsbyi TaxID=293091 RepID=J7RFU6_HALWD|nr:small CPxCG-related zinc finger protein [Haloquadratum walsbyi C23]CCL97824.1 small CPxCG-related zinc finger protein [Haloquadratum walsbyi DSM 16790]
MRPSVDIEQCEMYECPTCGVRASERGECESCETELISIGCERDL